MAYVSAKDGNSNDVLYTDDRGVEWIHSDGSRAWRNNNPGNIEKGDFANFHGAIGSGGRFAVFPDEMIGRSAVKSLLEGKNYRDLSIKNAISRYAPPSENDVATYQDSIRKYTGLDIDRHLKDLSDSELDQVVNAIQRIEGWKPGTITRADSTPQATSPERVVSPTVVESVAFPVDIGAGHAVSPDNIEKHWVHTEIAHRGGYFPIGGNSVWHGGIHLRASVGTDVVACADADVVAARLIQDPEVATGHYGSVNFILLKHRLTGDMLNKIAALSVEDGAPVAGVSMSPSQGNAGLESELPGVYEATEGLRLRAGMGTQAQIVGTLHQGDVVSRNGYSSVSKDGYEWWSVTVEKSANAALKRGTGFVASTYLTPSKQPGGNNSGQTQVSNAVTGPFGDTEILECYSLYMHLQSQDLTNTNKALANITWIQGQRVIAVTSELNLRISAEVRTDNMIGTLTAGDRLEQREGVNKKSDGYEWVPVRVASSADTGLIGKKGWIALVSGRYQYEFGLDKELIERLDKGKVIKVEGRSVKAGEKLWTSGEYGSYGYRTGLVHWEIFSEKLLFPNWKQSVDQDSDFNIDAREIVSLVEQEFFGSDDILTLDEVAGFYAKGGQAKGLRTQACKFQNEWAVDLDIAIPKMKGTWFAFGLKEKMQPYQWWNDAAAVGVSLPSSSQSWHYNPIKVVQVVASIHRDKIIRRNGQTVPHYAQGASAWGSRSLGKDLTVKGFGCAMASVAMTLSYYGRDVDPGKLDAWLDQHSGYSGEMLNFEKAVAYKESDYSPKLKYSRKNTKDSSVHRAIIEERVRNNLPTIVEVDYGNDKDSKSNHFVVVVGLTEESEFIMNDPASSKGNGVADPSNDNVIQTTTRQEGYSIISLRLIDPT